MVEFKSLGIFSGVELVEVGKNIVVYASRAASRAWDADEAEAVARVLLDFAGRARQE